MRLHFTICVTAYLKKISGNSIHLLRAYGESIENEDFPKPGYLMTFKARSKLADRERDRSLQSISLHHMVREGESPEAVFIRLVDGVISRHMRRVRNEDSRNNSNDADDDLMSEENLKKYRKAIRTREQELLGAAHVILCTCTTSSAPRLRLATNIQQVSFSQLLMATLIDFTCTLLPV